jgi:glutamate-1-semialdehyde aminotransferase
LEKVRDLASKKNIVLIFDECSSGFRETFGGIYSKYNVEPDIIIFGKTLGNGYGITSVLGKREIMENAQNTFISSTFWTERIGPTAALATLNEMEKIKSWEVITRYGKIVRDGWINLANLHNLEIEVKGIPAISTYEFKSKKNQEYKTYVAQEMLKKGILASTFFYASTAHNSKLINLYLDELDSIFQKISNAEKGVISIDDMLDGPVCNNRFVRLN